MGELLPDPLALSLSDPLDDSLLGGHDGIPAELGEVHGNLHHVPDLEGRIVPAGLLQRDLGRGVLDLVDDPLEYDDVDFAAQIVDLDLGPDVRTEYPSETRQDPVLDQIVHLVGREALGCCHISNRGDDLSGVCHSILRRET